MICIIKDTEIPNTKENGEKSKMKRRTTLLILATAFVISACTPIPLEGTTETSGEKEESASEEVTASDEFASDETTEETTEASTDETAEAESSTDEITEVEGEPVSDEELSDFTKRFTATCSDCFGFLGPEYSSPEEIKWDRVIAYRVEGLTEDEDKLPDEEKIEFYGSTELDLIVDTVVRMDKLIKYAKDHTGLDINIDPKDYPFWTYNEKYDSILIGCNPWGDDSPLYDGKFVSGTKSGDTYTLKYQPNNENWDEKYKQPERIITFTKSGDNLVFKSNKFGKK